MISTPAHDLHLAPSTPPTEALSPRRDRGGSILHAIQQERIHRLSRQIILLKARAASPPAALEVHTRVRAQVEEHYRKSMRRAMGSLSTMALADRQRAEDEARKAKRKKEEQAAVLLLLLIAGATAYRAMKSGLAPITLGGSITPPTPLPPSTPAPGRSTGPTPVPVRVAPPIIGLEELEREAREFSLTRQALLAPFVDRAMVAFWDEVQKGIEEGLTEDQIAERLAVLAEDWEQGPAENVVQTETQAAYGSAQIDLLRRAGFTTKIWQTMEDERVRPSHVLCGEQGDIPMDKPFTNGLMYPGDPNGGPEEVCNCRCWLVGGKRAQKPMFGWGQVRSSEVQASDPTFEGKHPRGMGGKWVRKAARDIRIGDFVRDANDQPTRVHRKQMNRQEWNHVRLYLESGGSTQVRRDTEMDVLSREEAQPVKPEDYGLTQSKGMLGRMGYHGSTDPSVRISAQVDPKTVFVTRIDAVVPGQGAGGKALERIKDFAAATGRRVELTAGADTPELQPRLNAFYEKHGFKRTQEGEHPLYVWEPPQGSVSATDAGDTMLHVHAVLLSGQPGAQKVALIHNPTYERNSWHLPGGHIQQWEGIDEALRREIREEVGLEVEGLKPVESLPDLFYAQLEGEPELRPEHPSDEPQWVSIASLPDAPLIVREVQAALAQVSLVQSHCDHVFETLENGDQLCFECDYRIKAVEVREHQRRSKSGKIEFVHRYSDKRTKRPAQVGGPLKPGEVLSPYGVRLSELWGFSVVSVLRWMGSEGFKPAEAKAALLAHGINANPGTIYIQLNAGRKGRGELAKLSPEQQTKLREAIGAPPKPPTPEPPKPPVETTPPVPTPPVPPVEDRPLTREELKGLRELTQKQASLILQNRIVGARKLKKARPQDYEKLVKAIDQGLTRYSGYARRRIVRNVRRITLITKDDVAKVFNIHPSRNQYIAFYRNSEKLVATSDLGWDAAGTMAHEFAHALDRRVTSWLYDYSHRDAFIRAWKQDCIGRTEKAKSATYPVKRLRDYANTNSQEGFACAIEEVLAHGPGEPPSEKHPDGTGLFGRAPNIARLLVKWNLIS